MSAFASKRVLLVGVGGLGCPAAIVLARAGVGTIGIADDDRVDVSNLHRQILFDDSDVGKPKTATAAAKLRAHAVSPTADATADASENASATADISVIVHDTRLLPSNAVALVSEYDLVVEGSDNFATKFLAADACAIAKRPIVHAAAVRWHGTALAVSPGGAPCYRCVFEDVPLENAPNCAEAGVVGPLVGVVAAAQADLALSILEGDTSVFGELFTFDGKTLATRRRHVATRAACPLCSSHAATRKIKDIEPRRYVDGVTS